MTFAQNHYDSGQIRTKKIAIASIGHSAIGTACFIALNKAWYSNYSKEKFHLFNDLGEWNQMDKAGHIWTSYQLARASTSIWKWTGMNQHKSILLGSLSAFSFQSIIEMQDAYSVKWGFSITDMIANIAGISTFAFQDCIWNQQRIQIKFQYFPFTYPNSLKERRNQLFGTTFPEHILKDYNSQTYWLSMNIHSFYKESKIPKWLNLAIGYNARLMLGGTENIWTDSNGGIIYGNDQKRYRRFLLSADIDLTKIETKNKIVRNLLFAFNSIKIPFPAFEWNTLGKIKFHPIY